MKDCMSYIGHKKDQLCEILLVLGRGGVRVSSLCSLLGGLFPVGSYMPKCKNLSQMIKPTDYEKKSWNMDFFEENYVFESVLQEFFLNNSYIDQSGNIA